MAAPTPIGKENTRVMTTTHNDPNRAVRIPAMVRIRRLGTADEVPGQPGPEDQLRLGMVGRRLRRDLTPAERRVEERPSADDRGLHDPLHHQRLHILLAAGR